MRLCEKLNNRRRREQNKKTKSATVSPNIHGNNQTRRRGKGKSSKQKNHLVTSAPLIPNFSSSILNTVEQYTTRITHKSDEIRKMIIRVAKHTQRKSKKTKNTKKKPRGNVFPLKQPKIKNTLRATQSN